MTQNQPLLRKQMPELDSIRGVAILAVLFYHGFYWQIDLSHFSGFWKVFLTTMWAGRLGVNLFFVLSGFLITGILLDSGGQPNYYARFYIRRGLRILPAYAALMMILAMSKKFPSSFLVLSLAYMSNLAPLFGVPIAYTVLWSLAVEEHFYFVWPAVVRYVSRRNLLWICATVIIVSPVARYFSLAYSQGYEFNEYTWNSLDGLAAGAAFAVLVRDWKQDRAKVLRLIVALVISCLVLGRFGITSRSQPTGAALQIVPWQLLFVAVLAGSLMLGTSRSAWIVHLPILRFYGRISYGLYLIHLLIFSVYDRYIHNTNLGLRFAVVLCASTLIAWLSREQFEERFLQLQSTTKIQKIMRQYGA